MVNKNSIKLFGGDKIRAVWDDEQERWYFSIVDVVAVLTESKDFQTARKYWNKLKQRLKEEGFEPVTNCHQLKMPAADGKMRLTDVADTEQLLRIIQSMPSPKAEPFKMWLAKVGTARLDQMQDPELSIQQAMIDYKRLGYSDNWINQRLKSIEIRKDLTDQWKLHNVEEGVQYATLTDIIYQSWAGRTSKEYKQLKAAEAKAAKAAKEAEAAAIAAAAPAQAEENLADDGELVAVIAAAIAAAEGTTTDGFVVRSIKRRKSNKWNA